MQQMWLTLLWYLKFLKGSARVVIKDFLIDRLNAYTLNISCFVAVYVRNKISMDFLLKTFSKLMYFWFMKNKKWYTETPTHDKIPGKE